MSLLPVVAIVGRPNVGKSSLLNASAGKRISIVDDTPGVTRDRVAAEVSWGDRVFELVDTGGIGIIDSQALEDHVEMQIETAIERADVIVFLVDSKDGLVPLDQVIAERLRKVRKPVLLAANKVDVKAQEAHAAEFFALGIGDPMPVSAKERFGLDDLLDAIVERLPEKREDESQTLRGLPRIAIVGQRNAGKSTLLNAVLGEERVIVSEVPGTTRDSVDVRARWRDREFVAIDTAGMRKKSSVKDSIEFYGQVRSEGSIRRAHVVIHLFDATRDISQVDKKISQSVAEAFKPCVLAVNKWDLAQGMTQDQYARYLMARLPWLHFAPVVFLSAANRDHVDELFEIAFELYEQAGVQVPTPDLNRAVMHAQVMKSPKVIGGKLGKVYYAAQSGARPPTIVLFVNDPSIFAKEYMRFIENHLRRTFPFGEIPLRILLRSRRRAERTTA